MIHGQIILRIFELGVVSSLALDSESSFVRIDLVRTVEPT
jgi:hypothetical protein